MKPRFSWLCLLCFLSVFSPTAAAPKLRGKQKAKQTKQTKQTKLTKLWRADRVHSAIQFSTSHFGVYDLVGRFDRYDISMLTRKAPRGRLHNFLGAVITGRIFIKSVNMPSKRMMGSLKNPGYFHARKYPTAHFKGTIVKKIKARLYLLKGKLTIKGKTSAFTMKALFRGYSYPGEKDICGFKVTGLVDRHFFKVGGKHRLHSGFPVVGRMVKLVLHLRMEAR